MSALNALLPKAASPLTTPYCRKIHFPRSPEVLIRSRASTPPLLSVDDQFLAQPMRVATRAALRLTRR